YYESPHRILDMMADAIEVFGADRPCVLGRELTKTFETFYAGTAGEVLAVLTADPHGTRGEFVVMFQGAAPAPASDAVNLDADRLLALLTAEMPVKKAAKIVAEVSGLAKNDLYQRALALKDGVGN
ncbi:MAG: rRNA (cytidine-2'-O-)-methyltransferase, partial [Marinobacter sp. 34-60-7]